MLAAERYDGAEPVNLGTGEGDLDPRAGRARRRADAASRARSSGTPRCRTASRGAASTPRGRSESSGSRRRRRCARGSSGRSPGTANRRPLKTCMRLPERARPIWAWLVAHQPWSVLGAAARRPVARAARARGHRPATTAGSTTRAATRPTTGRRRTCSRDWTLPVTPIGYGVVVPADADRALRRRERPLRAAGGAPAEHRSCSCRSRCSASTGSRRGSAAASSATGRRSSGCSSRTRRSRCSTTATTRSTSRSRCRSSSG